MVTADSPHEEVLLAFAMHPRTPVRLPAPQPEGQMAYRVENAGALPSLHGTGGGSASIRSSNGGAKQSTGLSNWTAAVSEDSAIEITSGYSYCSSAEASMATSPP